MPWYSTTPPPVDDIDKEVAKILGLPPLLEAAGMPSPPAPLAQPPPSVCRERIHRPPASSPFRTPPRDDPLPVSVRRITRPSPATVRHKPDVIDPLGVQGLLRPPSVQGAPRPSPSTQGPLPGVQGAPQPSLSAQGPLHPPGVQGAPQPSPSAQGPFRLPGVQGPPRPINTRKWRGQARDEPTSGQRRPKRGR